MTDSEPIGTYAAFLMSADPTGKGSGSLRQICVLTAADYRRYADAYQALHRVLFANTFAYFRGSAKAFHSIWTEANDALAQGKIRPTHDPDGFVLWSTQLRSAALSLCLSLCYHQEQTYQEICDKHGKNSDAHNAAKGVFAGLYDTFPGYRYMYALRNVMIHDAMDAISMKASAQLDASGQPIGMWDLRLDRVFLSKSKALNADKRAEFASLTENPSLPGLFAQIADPMSAANTELLSILHPDLTDACRTAVEFDGLFGAEVGLRALVEHRRPGPNEDLRLNLSAWSNEIIQFARSYERGQGIRR
jgi:hypothetical protein